MWSLQVSSKSNRESLYDLQIFPDYDTALRAVRDQFLNQKRYNCTELRSIYDSELNVRYVEFSCAIRRNFWTWFGRRRFEDIHVILKRECELIVNVYVLTYSYPLGDHDNRDRPLIAVILANNLVHARREFKKMFPSVLPQERKQRYQIFSGKVGSLCVEDLRLHWEGTDLFDEE